MDHFSNDETLRTLLRRAARFWPDRRCWNAQCLRSALRVYGGGRVSNFRPTAARAIIARYSEDGQTILDFSAGYGGRLLGCLTLNRNYIGIDPAASQIAGLTEMVNALQEHSATAVELVKGCAEDVMPELRPRSVDLIFSSPPYFKVERYSTEANQSYRRYPTYDAWKEQFLRRVLVASHALLRRGGRLILNVADTSRHPIASDLASMKRGLFQTAKILKLLMHSRPAQRSSGGANYRWEPVLVLKKA